MTIKCETAGVIEPRAQEEGRGKLVANGRGDAKVRFYGCILRENLQQYIFMREAGR